MKGFINYLWHRGYIYTSVIYLNDILCLRATYDECRNNGKKTWTSLKCLGFIINYEKSTLELQICRSLGFVYNTVDIYLSLPDNKRQCNTQLESFHHFLNALLGNYLNSLAYFLLSAQQQDTVNCTQRLLNAKVFSSSKIRRFWSKNRTFWGCLNRRTKWWERNIKCN